MEKIIRQTADQLFQQWLSYDELLPHLKEELLQIQDQPQEIKERFYTDLSFGTGGLRGIIGAGTNRMNSYTVRKATLGLAYYLKERYQEKAESIHVVIAYDCRHQSIEFAEQAALTLNQEQIRVSLYPELRPTPQLSYTVRALKAQAGIVITASHNPPEYNGFKVYGEDGAQINLNVSDRIVELIQGIENELLIPIMQKEAAIKAGRLIYLDEQMDEKYVEYVASLALRPAVFRTVPADFKLVFTPLHGTALYPVTKVFERVGFKHLHIVSEQAAPDPNFSTVASPNPEEQKAFELAIDFARNNGAKLVIGTDPDADRMGVVVPDPSGEYKVLTGNQTGALLLNYILEYKKSHGQLSPLYTICKTIVTSELGRAIGQAYGIETLDTLTGFKFIGEKMKEFEETGERQFLFGYEESYGYLIGEQVRDKDAVQAVLMVTEMAAYYHTQGLSLLDKLHELYTKHGFYKEKLISQTKQGLIGLQQIQETIRQLRSVPPQEIGGIAIEWIEDYQTGVRLNPVTLEQAKLTLPVTNVLKYILAEGTWVCIRPSGTEPKLKVYIGVLGSTEQEADEKLERIAAEIQLKWLS